NFNSMQKCFLHNLVPNISSKLFPYTTLFRSEIEIELKQELKKAIMTADLAEEEEIPEINLEKPKEKTHGDFAANIAMQLAKIAKKAPRQIAEDIVAHLDTEKAKVAKVEIAGPGFINFFMKQDFLTDIVQTIIKEKDTY